MLEAVCAVKLHSPVGALGTAQVVDQIQGLVKADPLHTLAGQRVVQAPPACTVVPARGVKRPVKAERRLVHPRFLQYIKCLGKTLPGTEWCASQFHDAVILFELQNPVQKTRIPIMVPRLWDASSISGGITRSDKRFL